MIKEFKDFIMRGNVIELAVGIIIGAAFSGIVSSLIQDVITPLLLKPALDAAQLSKLEDLTLFGTVHYGMFLSSTLNFIIIAFILFLIIKVSMPRCRKTKKRSLPNHQKKSNYFRKSETCSNPENHDSLKLHHVFLKHEGYGFKQEVRIRLIEYHRWFNFENIIEWTIGTHQYSFIAHSVCKPGSLCSSGR